MPNSLVTFQPSDNFRYERKYLIPTTDEAWVAQSVLLNHGHFTRLYQPRSVYSIYFDTPGLDYYQLNVLGAYERKKVRLRWYQQGSSVSKPQIEVKYKQGEVNQKKVIALNENIQTLALSEIESMVQKQLATIVPEAPILKPTVSNRYFRDYFFSEKTNIRITVDSQISFFDKVIIDSTKSSLHFPHTILECKYDIAGDDALEKVLINLPFHATKSSKYVMGLQLAKPELIQ